MWGISPKGRSELKKRIQEGNVANVTRSAKHYKLSFLEKDHPIGLDENEEKKKDRFLTQMKRTQAHVSI